MRRALLLSGGVGHDFAGTSATLVDLLQADTIAATVVTDPAEAFERLAAEPWDLFVVNALRWRMLAERYADQRAQWAITTPSGAQACLSAHLARGAGVLVMHTGVICFDDWPGWGETLGASWDWEGDRSFHPALDEVDVQLADGTVLTLTDEVYGFLAWHGPVEVLAHGHHTGADHPIIWRRERGGGRVAVDLLGHGPGSYANELHASIVRGLATWAARGDEP